MLPKNVVIFYLSRNRLIPTLLIRLSRYIDEPVDSVRAHLFGCFIRFGSDGSIALYQNRLITK